jgi:hypothetical protein
VWCEDFFYYKKSSRTENVFVNAVYLDLPSLIVFDCLINYGIANFGLLAVFVVGR